MNTQIVIKKAHAAGGTAAQVALCEFILTSYKDELTPKLDQFLRSVLQDCYERAGIQLGKPAEDVALAVNEIVEKRIK